LAAKIAHGNSANFGLNLSAPFSAIEEAKQDFQPLRQLLGMVKFVAAVLSVEQRFPGGDAHTRLRDFVPRFIDGCGRLLVCRADDRGNERPLGTFPYK
jgi:hypothetical protein